MPEPSYAEIVVANLRDQIGFMGVEVAQLQAQLQLAQASIAELRNELDTQEGPEEQDD